MGNEALAKWYVIHTYSGYESLVKDNIEKLIENNDMWYLITNTRGVTGFVGPQGKAIPLGEEEVRKMRLEEKVVECNLAVGDEVNIISGPLASFTGVVESLDDTAQKARVKVSMFGRETDVELDFIQLDKIKGLYDA